MSEFLIRTTACSIIVIASSSYANEQDHTTENALERIEIRAFNDSVVKSLSNKRHNQQVSDTISAEDIGKFPDKNVAEALQRITGISLSRAQGEGERIGVRGTTPEQNRTYLNGQYLASADWWISSQPSRGFNFTLLPSEIVSSLEVYKTPQASQDEGSLGGAINIKTRDPLLTPSGYAVVTAQLQYNDLSDEVDPQLSAVYNYHSPDHNYALLFTATKRDRSLRRDGLESWGWHERTLFQGSDNNWFGKAQSPSAKQQTLWFPGGGGSALFQQQRELHAYTIDAAIQFSPRWRLDTYVLYSHLNADNNNQNFLWQSAQSLDFGGAVKDIEVIDGTLVNAHYLPVDGPFNTGMEAIWRDSQLSTKSAHLDLHYDGIYWSTQWQLGASLGDGGTAADVTSQFAANTGFWVNTSGRKNILTNYTTSPSDGANWFLTQARKDSQNAQDDAYFAQADFTYAFNSKVVDAFKFGFKLKDHQRDFIRYRSQDGGLNGLAGQLKTTLADYSASLPKNYLKDIGNEQTLKHYSYANLSMLARDFDTLNFQQEVEKASRFNISEQTLASYGQLQLSTESFSANIGMRLVKTIQDSGAFKRVASPIEAPDSYLWQQESRHYTDILPSANLKVDINDAVVARFAMARVMSRAQFHHLMPSTNYNVTQAQGQGGNANLDPYRAAQFDASLEWYFADAGLASIAVFNKDVESFIEFERKLEHHEGILMSIDRPNNGAGGSIRGMELSYQQALAYGFGVIANYTFVDGKRDNAPNNVPGTSVPGTSVSGTSVPGTSVPGTSVPGTSRHSANITAYYEDHQISIRLSYNYRTRFATGIGETMMDNYGQLDGNLSIKLTHQLDLQFEFINLTDEQIYTFDRNEYAPTGIYANGRRFYAGLRYQF
ncbi:TonB-dependent receptor [Pseudoalteromonas sp. S16_S37]|uniref:TonB-dependent receptor n=1 Tax=Pseudoalteromonas sp. S16_S37 TaxID=2720228 RepID=UPI00168046B9|nr:TonB-dependent receptor [Pseudoalteromonas sp. S16_S37]MBD1581096.1 TonB-dependent receptor [Pseudoalteromonas sp. S16_S37]